MNKAQLQHAMERAIEVAGESVPEDDRNHPKVGAILTDANGKEILAKCRGADGKGGHAEFLLIEEAKQRNIELSDKILFVTLEPCSRRSITKQPCAVRLAQSGIKTVYVGTLDPNPQIIGRGVNYLIAEDVTVEHFPAELREKIIQMNAAFQGTHSYLVDPIVTGDPDQEARQRAGILATTLDLIATAKSEVRIFTGNTSWLGDLFVGLLEASLRGLPINMLVQGPLAPQVEARAISIGVTIGRISQDRGIRGTMVLDDRGPSNMLLLEPSPARHAQLFSAPHDGTVLNSMLLVFNEDWKLSNKSLGSTPTLNPIPNDEVFDALKSGVPAYQNAEITLADISLRQLQILTNDVEVLKLRRVASTLRIMAFTRLKGAIHIAGTPWAFFPPIVERDPAGNDVLIDGIHRVFLARQRNEERMQVLLVKGVTARLPATPINELRPSIIAAKHERGVRYTNYEEALFRPIRHALEAGPWTKR